MTLTVEKILLEFSPSANNILPALKRICAAFGYVDGENAEKIADYFSVPKSQIYETASFFDLINTEKPSACTVRVCFSTHCALKDSKKIIAEIENILHVKLGDVNHPKLKLEMMSCVGRCGEGPIVMVNDKVYEKVTVAGVYGMLEEYL
ncbi:MAG: NAD(P)H-dependent oxidoreductase subunit E [Parcubacteria group bacterium]